MDCGSEPSRHDLEASDISVGDTDDDEVPGTAVVQMASNPLVPCDRLAEVTHTQTGRPRSRRLVLTGTHPVGQCSTHSGGSSELHRV